MGGRPPLRPNQLAAVMHMIDNPRQGLFLPMGFGKTRCTIEALEWFGWPRTLIVGTKQIVEKVWPAEIEKWAEETPRVSLIAGTPVRRIAALAADADVYVISRDNLAWMVKDGVREVRKLLAIRSFPPFEAIVLDELSSYKSWRSSRFRAARALIERKGQEPRIVWGLTGTPASDHLMDLFAESYLLDSGETFGRSVTDFRDRYFEPDNPYKPHPKYIPREGAESDIIGKLSGLALSMGHEAMEGLMPPLTISKVEIPMPSQMWDGPKGYRTFMANEVYGVLGYKSEQRETGTVQVPVLADWHISTNSVAALRAKGLQYTAGFIYREDRTVEHVNTLKLDMLTELIENLDGQPVLVFYRFKEEARRILERLPQTVEIKEPGAVDRWNDGKIPVLLAHPASAGHGLNLQFGGSHVIFTTIPDSQDQFSQGIARLHRPGQQQPVMAHILHTPGTWDDLAFSMVMNKRDTDARVLSHLEGILTPAVLR